MHDQADPVGVSASSRKTIKGLLTKGRLLIETQRGKDVHAMVKAGAVDGLSMGYRTVKSRFDTKAKARMLDRVDLWEISLVTIPMLQSARVTAVKNFNPRELEGCPA
jgi:HK97 family phage prohead protease